MLLHSKHFPFIKNLDKHGVQVNGQFYQELLIVITKCINLIITSGLYFFILKAN